LPLLRERCDGIGERREMGLLGKPLLQSQAHRGFSQREMGLGDDEGDAALAQVVNEGAQLLRGGYVESAENRFPGSSSTLFRDRGISPECLTRDPVGNPFYGTPNDLGFFAMALLRGRSWRG